MAFHSRKVQTGATFTGFIQPSTLCCLDGQEAEEPSAWAHPPCAFPGDMPKGLPDGMQLRG